MNYYKFLFQSTHQQQIEILIVLYVLAELIDKVSYALE